MPEHAVRAAVLAEHAELKRRTEELLLEHQRLMKTKGTRAEHRAHGFRLQSVRRALEEHYGHLRELAHRRDLDRQRGFIDTLRSHN